MKTPFGIERLQSGQSLLFVERALPNNLVPNRDVGLQVHGELAKGVLGYQAAVLNGVPDGGVADDDTNDSKDLAGRVFLQPWRNKGTSPLRGLGFGLAGTTGQANGPLRPYASVSQVPVFAYAATVTANGDRNRWSPQASLLPGTAWACSPNTCRSQHEVQKIETGKPTTTASLQNSAWSVTGSVLLTGEEASYGNVKPKNFFVPSAGKWGGLAAGGAPEPVRRRRGHLLRRICRPHALRAPGPGLGRGPELDLEQQPQVRARLRADALQGGAAGGADRPTEKSVQTRLQLSF